MDIASSLKHPATYVVHWLTGPVYACDDHAVQLMWIARYSGGHIVCTPCREEVECANCVNAVNNTGETQHD